MYSVSFDAAGVSNSHLKQLGKLMYYLDGN